MITHLLNNIPETNFINVYIKWQLLQAAISYMYCFVIQGIEQIKNEVEDPGEALIDGIFGHGRLVTLAFTHVRLLSHEKYPNLYTSNY